MVIGGVEFEYDTHFNVQAGVEVLQPATGRQIRALSCKLGYPSSRNRWSVAILTLYIRHLV
jgi:hypothetical protein